MKRIIFTLVVLATLLLAVTSYAQSPTPEISEGANGINGIAVEGQAVPTQPATTPEVVPEGWYVINGVLSQTPPKLPPPVPLAPANDGSIQDGVLLEGTPLSPDTQPSDGEILQPEDATAHEFCAPFGLIRINFDEVARPTLFNNTTALHTDYRLQGVLFNGPTEKDGGAVLDGATFFGITGYSSPNFLAFNTASTLSDGGKPTPPEEIFFPGGASFVSVRVASNVSAGTAIEMEAFDLSGASLGTNSLILSTNLETLEISGHGISRVVISTTATVFVLDDLAYTPESYLESLSFDEISRPTFFVNTTALRTDYQDMGLLFDSPIAKDGGAVLNGVTFSVTGYSFPNFLAFNTSATLSDGGKPRPPEEIEFTLPVDSLTLFAASPIGVGAGQLLTIEAFDQNSVSLGTDSLTLGPAIQPLSITVGSDTAGIARVVIDTPASVLVVDDLLFVRKNAAYIDFDDAAAPSLFANATALRDHYDLCWVLFNGPATNDGGAILDENGGFGVSGFSARNFLAFNAGATLSDGGIPRDPEEINLAYPASYVLVYAGSGSGAGQPVTLEAFDENGVSLGTDTLTMASNLQPLRFLAPGIRKVTISSPANVFVLDNLTIVFEPPAIDFSGNPLKLHAFQSVNFTNTSTGGFSSCTWDFGDGGTSTVCPDTSHTYLDLGKFNVTLTLSWPGGNQSLEKVEYVDVNWGTFVPILFRAP